MTAHVGSLTAGTKLWRIHSADPDRDVLTLNPTPAGAGGGRFDSSDGSYHYSYFGEDISTCIAETYCRSLPLDDHVPRILRKAKLAGRVLSQVTVTDDVPVALVHGSHLAAIGQDTWLTKCDPVDYRTTRHWAASILHGTAGVLGIKYRARNDEDRFSVVMTIKPNAGVELHELMAVSRDPIKLDDRAGLELVRSHLAQYNATLI
ncbi:RES family NAD+ phosphorylase [Rhodococcus sp. MSC1_016]|uniref:RES family NAD+ phosphorylase n=1 Tax=Rhodococcus sp. MSC1_016 TaxID=2909266 RepID=UPI00202F48FC|nr:RES family NAD+ phosphorylase [Rhodococcus sp. MSC1_016]